MFGVVPSMDTDFHNGGCRQWWMIRVGWWVRRNRSTNRRTDRTTDDRAFAVTNFSADNCTNGTANAATDGGVYLVDLCGGIRPRRSAQEE